MSSEKQIDNYIDEMYEENQIYVQEELDYANKCHKLEEEVGCPLEVREQALQQEHIWYDDYGKLVNVTAMQVKYIRDKDKKICVLYCVFKYNLWISLKCKDYKKTWWLKEDKSE